jgi:hypothetical protein
MAVYDYRYAREQHNGDHAGGEDHPGPAPPPGFGVVGLHRPQRG